MPVYNVEKYIQTSVLSAFSQTFDSIEYIIIDDCGNDKSMDILEEILKVHPRKNDVFIYRHNLNQGLSAARNTGLKNAHGDFVFFMDSDDEITEDCIEKHYNAINLVNADFTIANIQLVGAKSVHVKDVDNIIEHEKPIYSFLKKKWNVSACNKLYRRSFLSEYNIEFVEKIIHEDVLWSYQVAINSNKLTCLKEKTYKYKIHNDSITRKKNNKVKIESLLYILKFLKDDFYVREYDKIYFRDFYSMFDALRFNTALLLLDYDGMYTEAKFYYNSIRSLNHSIINVYGVLLNMPFTFFKLLLSAVYKIYKY